MRVPTPDEINKLRIERIHKAFFLLDLTLSASSFVLSWIFISKPCSMSFYLYFCILYLGQSIQHFLCALFPKIDVVKYDPWIKKFIALVIVIQVSYLLLAFLFWTKSTYHPFYCFQCQVLSMPFYLGILFAVHFIITLFVFIQFLHDYITRKYYLLALGGFQVELRNIRQREQNLRQIALLQPYYNDYPLQENPNNPNKFYKFEDIKQDVEGQQVCSICLVRQKQNFHPIYTSCRHFFHRECIQQWAKLNSKCPECRAQFKQIQVVQRVQVQDNDV